MTNASGRWNWSSRINGFLYRLLSFSKKKKIRIFFELSRIVLCMLHIHVGQGEVLKMYGGDGVEGSLLGRISWW